MLLHPKPPKHTKKKSDTDSRHIHFIANLPCIGCGIKDDTIVSHHLISGIKGRGMAKKAEDRFTVPCCFTCHASIHRLGSDTKFFASVYLYDPVGAALALYDFSKLNDEDSATNMIMRRFI